MMPGLMQLTRAPRSPQVTAAACTRRWLACLEMAYAAPEFGTASGARTGSASSSSTGVKARARAVSGSSGGGMWPAMLEMCTPAPPGAMTFPNSSRTTAVPYRETASTASAGACTGETPAVLTTWMTSPRPAAAWARARTDAASDTSTRCVVTVWPASSSAVFAFCRLVSLKSASNTCLPAPVRRAMACPMLPAPMTTRTFVLMGFSFSVRRAGWLVRGGTAAGSVRQDRGGGLVGVLRGGARAAVIGADEDGHDQRGEQHDRGGPPEGGDVAVDR